GNRVEWITPADGLSSTEIARIYEDREGTIWAASLGGGLSALRRRAARTYGTAEGLQLPNVYPILWHGGALLVGTWGGGVFRFDGKAFSRAQPARGLVMSLAEGADGTLWASVDRDGVVRGDGRRFTTADGIPNAIVRVIHRAADGRLWLGTNAGLAVLDGER